MLDASYYAASPADQDIIYTAWVGLYTDRRVRKKGWWGREKNRVRETEGGEVEPKKEQLAHVGWRQGGVGGGGQVSTGRYRLGEIWGESRVEKNTILFHYQAPLILHLDAILTPLIFLYLSLSDLHLFSFSFSIYVYALVFYPFAAQIFSPL